MNLNQFNYLLTIHKCGSITKAAQELFVSVPSISSAIRNLEDELGCTLLLRHRPSKKWHSVCKRRGEQTKNNHPAVINLCYTL